MVAHAPLVGRKFEAQKAECPQEVILGCEHVRPPTGAKIPQNREKRVSESLPKGPFRTKNNMASKFTTARKTLRH